MISTEPLPTDPIAETEGTQLLVLTQEGLKMHYKFHDWEDEYGTQLWPSLPEGWNVVYVSDQGRVWAVNPVEKWESPVQRLIAQIEALTFHKDTRYSAIPDYVAAKHNVRIITHVSNARFLTTDGLMGPFTIEVDTGNGLDRITFGLVEDGDTLRLKVQEAA